MTSENVVIDLEKEASEARFRSLEQRVVDLETKVAAISRLVMAK